MYHRKPKIVLIWNHEQIQSNTPTTLAVHHRFAAKHNVWNINCIYWSLVEYGKTHFSQKVLFSFPLPNSNDNDNDDVYNNSNNSNDDNNDDNNDN